ALFVDHLVSLVGAHPIPIDRDAQTWTFRNGHVTVSVDGFKLVRVVARVYGRLGAAQARVDQAEFVIIGVTDGGHTVAVGRSGRMNLHVQSEALRRMGDLHQASDPAVVVRVGANEIGPVSDDVVD